MVQALIHVTTNDVRLRGSFYAAGAIVLLVMWLIFVVKIMLGLP